MSDSKVVKVKGDFLEFSNRLYDYRIDNELAKKLLDNVQFLEECVFALIVPQMVAESWNFAFTPPQYMHFLKDYFLKETGYSKDFVNKAFTGMAMENYDQKETQSGG